jgi:hypothetical protein
MYTPIMSGASLVFFGRFKKPILCNGLSPKLLTLLLEMRSVPAFSSGRTQELLHEFGGVFCIDARCLALMY